ncbi:MAG: hypothetical protein ABI367_02290 [Mucilaginibacter sp.]
MSSFTSKQVPEKTCLTIGFLLFAITWIGTGTQHLIYIEFVTNLVPKFMPARAFWVWVTGLGMLLAGISFLIRFKTSLAAIMLSIMMGFFIVLIHFFKLRGSYGSWTVWYRFIQDVSITGACLLITEKPLLVKTGRWFYALPVLLMGMAHFYYPEMVTARIPVYFPAKTFFNYVVGVLIMAMAGAVFLKYYTKQAALALAILLLAFALFYSGPPLVKNIKDAGQWTDFLLDLAVAAGAFFASAKLSDD